MKTLVCPDIMSTVVDRETEDLHRKFLPFSRKYNTYIVRHWSGEILRYNSMDLRTSCSFVKGAILSPNCINVRTGNPGSS